MAFLNPLVLLGLAAAAIPLIVHLFNFRKPKKVDFSSLAFVKALEKRTMKRVRLKQWLLLALRTLTIACLVLAFARPTLQGGGGALLGPQGGRSVALIIDNSLSMTLRDARGAYLDQAKALAAGVIDVLESDDEVFLFTTARENAGPVHAFASLQAAREEIGALTAATGPVSTASTVERAARRLQEAAGYSRQIVYVISDLQQSTWRDSLSTSTAANTPVRILPVGDQSHDNVAVTDVEIESRIIESGEPLRLTATLSNHGDDPIEGYVASAYLNDQRVAQASADLPVETPTEFTLTFTARERGWLPGRVRIGGDAFEQDNTRFFTLHVPRERELLLIAGRDVPTRYLDLAFSSRLSEGGMPFVIEDIAEGNLAAADLSAYDVVLLAGPATLSSGEINRLERFVSEGGGLLFFPGAAASASDYNALFDALGGGSLSGFAGSTGSRQPVASFESVDTEHPLFRGVFQDAQGEVNVEEPRINFVMNYAPSSPRGQTLIELSSGFPFLQELRHGRGAALIFAVAPAPQWSDLPVSGLFVPLLYRSAYYVSTGGGRGGDALTVGRPGELRLSGVSGPAPVHLEAPSGETFLPEQRPVYGALLLSIDESVRAPGIYDVRREEELIRRVAYNLAPRESDFARLEADDASGSLQEATGQPVEVVASAREGIQSLTQALTRREAGIELWNVFLLLALVFMVAEMLVARQWRPEAARTPAAA